MFFSLIQTYRLNDVNPMAYLTDVLGRLGTTPQSRIFDLTPRGWKAQRAQAAAAASVPA